MISSLSRKVQTLRRWLKAQRLLAPIVITFLRDWHRFIFFGKSRELTPKQHQARARRLTDAFEELGSTYIKLAQFLTTRPDLIPPIYVGELERLQDEVPPADFEEVRPRVEDELGTLNVFDYFETEAISGASIAQVHRAGIDGEDVAVKIRRPGLEDVVEADLAIMGSFFPFLVWMLRKLGQESHAESLEGITAELSKTIREEMDFEREAGIMNELRHNFARDGLDDRIIVPEPWDQYCTESVLVMKWEPGVKVKHIDELERRGHDLDEIVDAIADAYLHMAFTYDVFQADPHQGNLAVNDQGQAIIYDYGLAQRPPDELQDSFTRLFVGVGMQDPDIVIDAAKEMGAMDESLDYQTLYEATEIMIQDLAGDDIADSDIEAIEKKVDETLYDYPMRFPQEIILGMRTTFGLEGLCAKMTPDYDFTEKLHDFFIMEERVELPAVADVIEDRGLPGGPVAGAAIDRADEILGRSSLVRGEKPVTSFLMSNFDRIEEIFGGPPTQKAMTNGHFEEGPGTIDVEGLKDEIKQQNKDASKRIALSVFGGTMIMSAAILTTTASASVFAVPTAALGLIAFLLVRRSFREGGNVLGPKVIATRHNIAEWEDEMGTVDDVEDDAEAAGNGDAADILR
jgi:predicted unusual protein kinase regulating ubiquinone biosynthesis (AarF/ABC1/UbiB family)